MHFELKRTFGAHLVNIFEQNRNDFKNTVTNKYDNKN